MTEDRLQRVMEIISDSLVPLLRGTLNYTIPLSLISFSLGLVLALLVALVSLSPNRVLSKLARSYV